ncbi:MAG: S41 family peptidase [Bacteroidetes bacterium]|nr:S41 family peptidase [Bacteroidota bacterium]
MNNKNKFSVIIMPTIIALAIIIGMIIEKSLNKTDINNFIVYPKTNKINSVLNYIDDSYVDSVSKLDLIEKTIPSILKTLDPHSVYIPAKDFNEINDPLEGNFDGIGVQFNIQKDTVVIIKTIPGGPSSLVGLKDGDRIVKVNDSLIAGIKISTTDIMKLLKGPKDTKVKVGIARRGVSELINFIIIRDKIPIYSVDVSYMIKKDIGYIKINKFSKTTHSEFVENVLKLKKQGLKNLIVDLRDNGGGYMDEATNLADEFLKSENLIVFTKGRTQPQTNIYATSKGICLNTNVAVLINEWSASASEIFAGAIQDNDRGTVIGRRSYGKGLVQQPIFFSDGSSIRLTIARYYTPSGRCIQKPYKNNNDYYNDIAERFLHGEFTKKDSIHFPDSLKYITPKGKILYGGGGIMPDVFVPADTTGSSNYFTKISQKGLEYQFAFNFTDNNRKTLNEFKNYKELENYLTKQSILKKFIAFAELKGVKKNKSDIKKSGKIIDIRIKALIARNVLDNDGFFPIIQKIDTTLQTAVSILSEKK